MQRVLSEGLEKMHIELPTTVIADALFGFAFLESWNTDVTADTPYDRALLRQLRDGNRRRRGAIMLQHRVELALHLLHPMSIDYEAATADSLRGLWQQCLSCAMRVSGPGIPSRILFQAGRDRTVGDAIKVHCTDGTVVQLWPLPHLVAVAISAGVCGSDFSVVCQRNSDALPWRPPHLPSDLIFPKSTELPEATLHNIPTPTRSLTLNDSQRAMGFRVALPIEAKIIDTEVTWSLRSTNVQMDAHVAKVDRLQRSLGSDRGAAKCAGRAHMGKSMRRQNFSRLDVCGMLAQREVYAEKGPFFRFIATDKGPQQKGSWELLNTVEVAIPRSEVVGKALLDIDASHLLKRKLAPCCMAQSGTDLPNTVCSLLHQCWLDYGPTAAQVMACNYDVIGLGTDLGTEAGICDHHDVTDWFIGSVHARSDDQNTCQSVDPSQRAFLFPLALKIAGPLHCIDWIIRAAFNKITGFVEYLSDAKSIPQYMHSKTHRVFMGMKLRSLGLPAEVLRRCTQDLVKGCGRFADWRWRSLQKCTKDLARFELSICSACGGDNLLDFRLSRNAKAAAAFKKVTETQSFWRMNKLLEHLLGPLMKLHGFVQGCPCHPINSPDDSRPSNCPFQGLNCKGFSGKLAETIELYENMRSNGSMDEFGEVFDVAEVLDIIGFIIALLVLKLQRWVDDLPYLIWQVAVYLFDLISYIRNTPASPQVRPLHKATRFVPPTHKYEKRT